MKKFTEGDIVTAMIFGAILTWSLLYITRDLAIGMCG